MADPNSDLIAELKQKINTLVDRYKGLKSEVELLEEEKKRLQGQLDDANKEFVNLEQRYSNLKLTKELVSGASEDGDTRKRINQIVREIDKCIALLNR